MSVFWEPLASGRSLLSGDSNLGIIMARKSSLPARFLGSWGRHVLLGGAGSQALVPSRIITWWLPAETFSDLSYGLCLLVSAFLLGAFLRLRGTGFLGTSMAGLAAFWTGSNLTLLYPGHLEKFFCVMLAAAVLVCLEKLALTRRWLWGVLAGGALGGMFLEQQDVALFMGIFLGAYAVYATAREERRSEAGSRKSEVRGLRRPVRSLWALTLRLGPVVAVALLLVGPIIGKTYRTKVTETASVGEGAGEQQKWEFCTQWSLPVEESLDLVAPNFFGIRSGEPAGPYWGRTGQSAGWEQTKRGLRNLRTEGIYIGVIPIGMALVGLLLALLGRSSDRINGVCRMGNGEGANIQQPTPNAQHSSMGRRGDIIFWGVVAVVTLLLSYGKFAPFYRWFWHLPMVHPIRNPNKHLHMFQIAIGILAAFGVDGLVRGQWANTKRGKAAAWSGVALFALAGVGMLAGAGVVKGARAALTQGFVESGWGQAAAVIVQNMTRALMHGGWMAVVGGVCVAWVVWARARRTTNGHASTRIVVGCVCVMLLVATVDYVKYSREYVRTVDTDAVVGKNAVTEFLRGQFGKERGQRVLFFSQSGFYNQWLSTLFRAHLIPSLNAPSMERLSKQHKEFLDVVGKNPLRLWELAGIRYALGPAQIWPQIQGQPEWKAAFEPAMGFNVFPRSGGVGVEPVRAGQTPQHLVLEYKRGMDRYTLVPSWQSVPDDMACSVLAKSDFDPRVEALVSPAFMNELPTGDAAATPGRVEMLDETVRSMRVRTQTASDQLMVISQRYDPDFKATVDGQSVPVVRCNFLCVGVPVPAGEHEVVIQYRPSRKGLYVQVAGVLAVLGAALCMAVQSFGGRRKG